MFFTKNPLTNYIMCCIMCNIKQDSGISNKISRDIFAEKGSAKVKDIKDKGIGMRFRMINNAVRRYVDHNSYMKKEIDNVTCSNGWIIGHLCRMEELGRDVYQRDFETDFGITRSTVSKVLKLLEKKGMIVRTAVSHDGRMKKIGLTDRSREIGKKMHDEYLQMERQLTSGFSGEELKTLCAFLDRIQANLEENDKNEGREDI